MNKMNKLYTPIFCLAFFVAACGSSDKQQAAQAPNAIPVSTETVSKKQVTTADSYPATIVPLQEVELRAQVSGYLTGIYFEEGSRVKKGQKLYEIDRTKYLASYHTAKSKVKAAQANLNRVSKDYERYQSLAAKDAIAKQRVDYAAADVQTAQADLESAQAGLSAASNDLTNAVITAPFDGTIGISAVRKGTFVSAGSTLLNKVSTISPIAAEVAINQDELERFTKIDSKNNSSADSTFTLVLPDASAYTYGGKIETIDRAIDPQTGTIKIRVSFPNPKGELTAGMNLNLKVRNAADSGDQITIPYKAATEQLGEYFVYVLGDSSKVHQQKVELGSQIKGDVVVREGLKGGETIVTDGLQNLREGAVVTTAATPPAGAKQ